MKGKILIALFIITLIPAMSFAGTKEELPTPTAEKEFQWWPFKVYAHTEEGTKLVDYVPLEKVSKKWKIAGLFPHMKDKTWIAANWALVQEAKRHGIEFVQYEAGGYENLSTQISQYDDLMAMGIDAVVWGPISPDGVAGKVKEGHSKGIVNTASLNEVQEKHGFDGKCVANYTDMAAAGVEAALDYYKDRDKVRVIILPGPAGSGWAEWMASEFRNGLEKKAPGKFIFLDEKYGDTGKSVQLRLTEDAFQTYSDIDLIYGCAPAAEVAVQYIREIGRQGKTQVIMEYENPDLLKFVRSGDIICMPNTVTPVQAAIAFDLAIRVLENKVPSFGTMLNNVPLSFTPANIDEQVRALSLSFAPEDYRPIFKVE